MSDGSAAILKTCISETIRQAFPILSTDRLLNTEAAERVLAKITGKGYIKG